MLHYVLMHGASVDRYGALEEESVAEQESSFSANRENLVPPATKLAGAETVKAKFERFDINV